MAWSLALILIAASIVLVTYMHRAVQKIRKNSYVYPSEAIIDQILPPVSLDWMLFKFTYFKYFLVVKIHYFNGTVKLIAGIIWTILLNKLESLIEIDPIH
jgi:hypothetical protein